MNTPRAVELREVGEKIAAMDAAKLAYLARPFTHTHNEQCRTEAEAKDAALAFLRSPEFAGLCADAERYRALRDGKVNIGTLAVSHRYYSVYNGHVETNYTREALDTFLDAARTQGD